MARRLDRSVLFSGDGDSRRLVEAVQRQGVRVRVVSTLRGTPLAVADELRRQAVVFIEIQGLAPRIARAQRSKQARIPTPARSGFRMADGGIVIGTVRSLREKAE